MAVHRVLRATMEPLFATAPCVVSDVVPNTEMLVNKSQYHMSDAAERLAVYVPMDGFPVGQMQRVTLVAPRRDLVRVFRKDATEVKALQHTLISQGKVKPARPGAQPNQSYQLVADSSPAGWWRVPMSQCMTWTSAVGELDNIGSNNVPIGIILTLGIQVMPCKHTSGCLSGALVGDSTKDAMTVLANAAGEDVLPMDTKGYETVLHQGTYTSVTHGVVQVVLRVVVEKDKIQSVVDTVRGTDDLQKGLDSLRLVIGSNPVLTRDLVALCSRRAAPHGLCDSVDKKVLMRHLQRRLALWIKIMPHSPTGRVPDRMVRTLTDAVLCTAGSASLQHATGHAMSCVAMDCCCCFGWVLKGTARGVKCHHGRSVVEVCKG